MADKDGITSDVRSREEEYFRRKDRELIERMREAAAADEQRRQLEDRSGIRDPSLLQELAALGFTPDTVTLLPLVPIVRVAWAEGGISGDERRLIERFARQRGVTEGSAADAQLNAWLTTRPAEEVFTRAGRLIRAMLDAAGGSGDGADADDLIRQCEEIAAASGGVMGFRKISAEERALLADIQSALKNS